MRRLAFHRTDSRLQNFYASAGTAAGVVLTKRFFFFLEKNDRPFLYTTRGVQLKARGECRYTKFFQSKYIYILYLARQQFLSGVPTRDYER